MITYIVRFIHNFEVMHSIFFPQFTLFNFTFPTKERFFHFPSRKYTLFRLLIKRQRGNKHFDVHLRRIRTVNFLSKDGKGASYEGRDGWKKCLFPARVGIFQL